MTHDDFVVPSKLYKYVSMEIARMIIGNKSIKFNNPSNFNDPMDCSLNNVYFDIRTSKLDPRVADDLQILIAEFKDRGLTTELLNEAYENGQKAKAENSGITCFSLNNNHTLMWAHYGDKHFGMCLEFDYSLPESQHFKDLKIDIQGYMKYGLSDKVNYCEDKLMGTAMQFMCKKSDWEYEQEYRLQTLAGEGIYEFNAHFLTGAVFGLKVHPTLRDEIITECRTGELGHIRFYQAIITDGEVVYRPL